MVIITISSTYRVNRNCGQPPSVNKYQNALGGGKPERGETDCSKPVSYLVLTKTKQTNKQANKPRKDSFK